MQPSINKHSWQKQAEEYLIAENYQEAAELYEQAIIQEPENRLNYWYLGLMLLLQGQEVEAQMTWLTVLSEAEEQEIYTQELIDILNQEAQRRVNIPDHHTSIAICQHIREIVPENINNLCNLLLLSLKVESFDKIDDYLSQIIELLAEFQVHNQDLLLETIGQLLPYTNKHELIFNFVKVALDNSPDTAQIVDVLIRESINISFFKKDPKLAIRFVELCLNFYPDNIDILTHISYLYQDLGQYLKGVETAKYCYEISTNIAEKLAANYLVIRSLMTASGHYWYEARERLNLQRLLAQELITNPPENLDEATNTKLSMSFFFFPYLEDNPGKNRYLQNMVTKFVQTNFVNHHQDLIQDYPKLFANRKQKARTHKKYLNIGYISHCFKQHSVGWLCRWLFKYHDSERFKIHLYSLDDRSKEISGFTKYNFASRVATFSQVALNDAPYIWEEIQKDEIDILVDLDSLTLDYISEIMSIKSAPIQVTWLGWDASGLPSIDYFIADPYVLPESAQDYYSEKIWRLPQTYIAVDGFEVDVPSLRREDLDIPGDAIVYLMNQKGYKRHPDHLRLQMKILQQVPNSYLLVKGAADVESSKSFFEDMAQEEGADFSHIIFLNAVASEFIHRANLTIADVVLDTYPYNGATTTMETLWMGIPIVTRVGEQFAARNSYTMMLNAGITEGIAWTADEYVEWGVRLGKDEKLRQQISWKLRQSRHTAPLWNAKQFTREMENAYEQMWQKYIDS
ncbi:MULTISPECIES: O-linked N-acetylglucosamine transferase, SPINDLY family protein [Nostocales]|uniref:O-linked N-acetylglucosamine transferase, SPINDLY family protein n=1 Tax=Dolichospermum flos-aquae UHCC 0037 TaxID=2590026 RepID=A0ACC7S0D9_DOLFA|nr:MULTISPECIES: O-linked N-acetylglucosamine transferase, SPINDLY family protein [Nostocales]MBO1064034.1 O-linked N-acetylglucosamine transferase, SPINDLY family protein [Anabaena sp. 54]MCX5981507.1 O-linked N-acetylglucosamine transferase, SPINDLY family protein [Nostocales cyanobacterium LacPavin_0920_SED1_MAG_38_18]MTJ41902.1 O-linked N-acetylglucosamine transferase, SPINDLY family protein [Dolichospermum flos-aquae UHCC 0037]